MGTGHSRIKATAQGDNGKQQPMPEGSSNQQGAQKGKAPAAKQPCTWVMPPASDAATLAWRSASSRLVLPAGARLFSFFLGFSGSFTNSNPKKYKKTGGCSACRGVRVQHAVHGQRLHAQPPHRGPRGP
jgi:hypothetical protein